MPVVMNQREQGSKKPEEKKTKASLQAVTQTGLLSDAKTLVAIAAGTLLLVVGLLGWSQGWFGGAAAAPTNAASQAAGKTITPIGSDDANPMGHKLNKGMGE